MSLTRLTLWNGLATFCANNKSYSSIALARPTLKQWRMLWTVSRHAQASHQDSRSRSQRGVLLPLTVFGKHCECIAQKCTHLERLALLASRLLLLSLCLHTQHGGHKKSLSKQSDCGTRTWVGHDCNKTASVLSANWAIRTVVPNWSYYEKWKMSIYLNFKSQLLLSTENSVNAENNE